MPSLPNGTKVQIVSPWNGQWIDGTIRRPRSLDGGYQVEVSNPSNGRLVYTTVDRDDIRVVPAHRTTETTPLHPGDIVQHLPSGNEAVVVESNNVDGDGGSVRVRLLGNGVVHNYWRNVVQLVARASSPYATKRNGNLLDEPVGEVPPDVSAIVKAIEDAAKAVTAALTPRPRIHTTGNIHRTNAQVLDAIAAVLIDPTERTPREVEKIIREIIESTGRLS